MNRAIKFRGMTERPEAGNGYVPDKFIYGFLFSESVIGKLDEKYKMFYTNVIPESVCQFTGLKDINGKDIYEGDILRYPIKNDWEIENFVSFEVFFHDNDSADSHIGWQFNRLHFHGAVAGYHSMENFLPKYTKRMEIIGNIFENPDLLTKD